MLKTLTSIGLLSLGTPTLAHANALGGFDFMSLMPIVMIFGVFYFLLLRPQQKKAKLHQEMVKSLKKGDRVVTSSGILGSIHKIVGENEIVLEVEDHVKIRMLRGTITEVVNLHDTSSSSSTTADITHFPKSSKKSEKNEGKSKE